MKKLIALIAIFNMTSMYCYAGTTAFATGDRGSGAYEVYVVTDEGLKVGNGTPTTTMNGEDAYVEGTFEVDGDARFDGAIDANSTLNVAGTLAAEAAATVGTTLSVTGKTTASDTLTALKGVYGSTFAFTSNGAIAGTLDVTGAATLSSTLGITGKTTASETITASNGIATSTMSATGDITVRAAKVVVSTATTSTASLYLGGVVAALPTTGYSAGTLVILQPDYLVYVASETVSGTFSWSKIGGQ